MGRSKFGVCITFVLGIMVTTPDVQLSGMVPVSKNSYIWDPKIPENRLKNVAENPSNPGALLLFSCLRPS